MPSRVAKAFVAAPVLQRRDESEDKLFCPRSGTNADVLEFGSTIGYAARMKYYNELIANIGRSMKAHPRSTVVMDAGNFKVIAAAKDPKKLARKLKRTLAGPATTVVFEQPDEKAIWILATRSAL